ncbi:hypothetical protein [Aquabacterium sp.]|uniref:hypothetical protein n=1 Tax=Aquabacterium sp. TaxID=1872578 RepID=UPI00248A3EE5|nr:hypothetical protein [Aquabacterium sp.]MDI1258573.1 hypothetical protein [Aquabacterium sp.]
MPEDINAKGQILFDDQAGGVFITGANGIGSRQVKPAGQVDYMSSVAMNDHGQVVGELRRQGDNLPRAFITGPQGKGVRELGQLGAQSSDALGINRRGQVVGILDSPTNGDGMHAFITGPHGIGMRDLTLEVKLPKGYLTHAYDVNDKGQVVAYDYYHGRAYLLTPLPR